MRKLLFFSVAMLLASGVAFAQSDITSSAHDLSATAGATELCVFCHTPHESLTALDAPLWNRDNSTSTGYTRYTSTISSTYQATNLPWDPSTDTDLSSLCMSCHDGTVGIGTGIHNQANSGTATAGPIAAGPTNLGTDLSSEHPVRMTFDATLVTADGELQLPTAPVALFNNSVECASCHDVHEPQFSPFLVMDNAGSALCLKCHTK